MSPCPAADAVAADVESSEDSDVGPGKNPAHCTQPYGLKFHVTDYGMQDIRSHSPPQPCYVASYSPANPWELSTISKNMSGEESCQLYNHGGRNSGNN